MAVSSRRRFSPQFKAEAVQLVLQSDRSIAEVAGELAINPGTLGNWVQKHRQANPEPIPDMSPADHGRLAELEEQNRRLKMENEFLKKSRGPLRPGAGLSEKSALIEAEKASFPIEWMCAQLGVARSSFYAWRSRAGQVTATQARREALKGEIQRVFDKQRGTAGCRRIAAILNDEGHPASVGLAADLMRELGLAAIQRKAYKRTTVPDEKAQVFADKLGRDFAPESHRPGEALVGDITYLRTGQGWLYLATVIDLATRKVIGWQTAEHMRASLVVDALEMARTQGQATPGAVFHSDHGSQYTSDEFVTYCTRNGFVQSMGRTGVCWDNAAAETFFATLKNEMYHPQVFHTRARARFAVAEYIEVFYNRRRPHSSLGYRTPARAWADAQADAAEDLPGAA
ncbi:IS3 family transposase [Dietzia cinnamea]|uniref:IS3 family transposase n=1 Tax=Dietzia TaxID=37914 RepID=UPI001290742E|nr:MULTISPECIES: IS3 family transposase [Dietzia]MCT1887053.1 IS3 family transposase [Dietzia cinnamea]MCT2058008.1 IS3 family transposase [Dietzia cinnamea]MCT2097138.1 IS3 family transposase [Dietzia cinnamea]MCT2119817.1 IS3 family transposase [Dietzia cinnamea]MCT2145229.1 IS3 family transposase [Dietzia cinnamea]